jgi:hypothetical protein
MNSFVERTSNRMANTMGNLPASVNGVVNSAMNSAVNGVATNLPRTHSFYTFLLVIIGAIVLGVVIVYVVRHSGLHRRWDRHEERDHREHRDEDRFKKEVWCFVGEDLTGRACVKVPSPASCDAERSYGSRPDCELQTANRLPSGVITNGGESMIPLASMGRIL